MLHPAAVAGHVVSWLVWIRSMKGTGLIQHHVIRVLLFLLPWLLFSPRLLSGSSAILVPGHFLCPGLLVMFLMLSISSIRLVWLNSRNLVDLVIPICRSVMVSLASEVLASLPSGWS